MILSVLLSVFGVKSTEVFATPAQPIKVTLVAEITVENATAEPLEGYVHRVAVPVEGHMQQKLLAVRQSGTEPLEKKPFPDDVGDYVELEWDIPSNTTSTREIYFDLEVTPYNLSGVNKLAKSVKYSTGQLQAFLQPAEHIESDAAEIVRLARQIQENYTGSRAQLKAAFILPQQLLHYRRQSTKGALYAVKHREGDCTEYAALFVALARAMGYPARMTSEFLFTKSLDFSQPNHHAAEVYLDDRWVPVDANLALEPEFGYGFGVGGNKKLVLNRNSVWVWSNLWPRGVSKRSGHVDADMHWRIEMADRN